MFTNRYSKNGIYESKYYIDKEYNCSYGGGNWLPNCTSYCVSRCSEASEKPVKIFTNRDVGHFPNAKNFWTDTCLPKRDTARSGCIAVWDGAKQNGYAGHVAFVEELNGNKIIVSQSNYGGTFFEVKEYEVEVGKVTTGVGAKFLGFIECPITDKRVERNESISQVKVLANRLAVRKSPNGEKWAGLYCPVGIFNIICTEEAGDYTWAKLDEEYWIALNDTDEWTITYIVESKDIEELRKEIKDLKAKISSLESENTQIKQECDNVKNELETTKNSLVKANDKIERAKGILNE